MVNAKNFIMNEFLKKNVAAALSGSRIYLMARLDEGKISDQEYAELLDFANYLFRLGGL